MKTKTKVVMWSSVATPFVIMGFFIGDSEGQARIGSIEKSEMDRVWGGGETGGCQNYTSLSDCQGVSCGCKPLDEWGGNDYNGMEYLNPQNLIEYEGTNKHATGVTNVQCTQEVVCRSTSGNSYMSCQSDGSCGGDGDGCARFEIDSVVENGSGSTKLKGTCHDP